MEQLPLSSSLQRSVIAKRLGLKSERPVSEREHSITDTSSSPPLEGTLASALYAGFKTAVCAQGYPLLFHKDDPDVVFELDEKSEKFVRSSREISKAYATYWGCVSPAFFSVTPRQQDPVVVSVSNVLSGDLSFEGVRKSQIDELRPVLRGQFCTGFEEDADDSFNAALSPPIYVDQLRTRAAFHAVFPDDGDKNPEPNGFQSSVAAGDSGIKSEKDPVGRIIVSYRHQNYGADRITYDDWLCAEYSMRNVMRLYGWIYARFWTDALLRQYRRVTSGDRASSKKGRMPWAEMGIRPYEYGPVVVLNLAGKHSVSDRFWLTVERRTGAFFYGTWITDDSGDLFVFLESNEEKWEQYSLAIVSSVSSSQKLSWPQDREDLLKVHWRYLEVDDVREAVELLRELQTFEAKQDYVNEDLWELDIAPEGQTLQWCGDLEALIDPPCLKSVFGTVGELTQRYGVRIVDIGKTIGEVQVMVVCFEVDVDGQNMFCAKRIYQDTKTGEIRARSVPRLVDADYLHNILQNRRAREMNMECERPKWLQQVTF